MHFTFRCVGKSINSTKREFSNLNGVNKPEKVIFVITTDGYENASIEFRNEQIKKIVQEQKAKNWEFLFFGANIDSFTVGSSMGIDKSFNYAATKNGLKSRDMMMECVIDYREEIHED